MSGGGEGKCSVTVLLLLLLAAAAAAAAVIQTSRYTSYSFQLYAVSHSLNNDCKSKHKFTLEHLLPVSR